MKNIDLAKTILGHTQAFAEAVASAIEEMVGLSFVPQKKSLKTIANVKPAGHIVIIHFIGPIHGYYTIAIPPLAASKILLALEGFSPKNQRNWQVEVSDFLNEVINVAVGSAIVGLKKDIGHLTYLSAISVVGSASFPKVSSGIMEIHGEETKLQCILSLDKVNLAIADALKKTRSELERKTEEAKTDGLTQLYNHIYFKDILKECIKESKKNETPLALIMIDVDDFRDFNTDYGHQAGDFVLKQVADIICLSISESHYAFRYGGDEIAIVMPETEVMGSHVIAVTISDLLRERSFNFKIGDTSQALSISISMGVTAYQGNENMETFIRRADKCLYQAKNEGKGRIVTRAGKTSMLNDQP